MSKLTREELCLLLDIQIDNAEVIWNDCSRSIADKLAMKGLIVNDDGEKENDNDLWWLSTPATVHLNAILNVDLPRQEWISPLEDK